MIEGLQQSAFSEQQKAQMAAAILAQMSASVNRVARNRPTQPVDDVAAFLTESDVRFLEDSQYTLQAKVQRMAAVLVRIGCCNPNETSFGKALNVLKSAFACQQLEYPQTFYSFMQELKSAVRARAKKLPACKIHLTQYGTPDALPAELWERAFSQEGPAAFKETLPDEWVRCEDLRLPSVQQLRAAGSTSPLQIALPDAGRSNMFGFPFPGMQPNFQSMAQMLQFYSTAAASANFGSQRLQLQLQSPEPLLALTDGTLAGSAVQQPAVTQSPERSSPVETPPPVTPQIMPPFTPAPGDICPPARPGAPAQ